MRRLLLTLAIPGLVVILAIIWFVFPRGPRSAEGILSEKGELRVATILERSRAHGVTTEDVQLASTTGLEVRALVQSPGEAGVRYPAVLLLGGMRTGRTAILHVPKDQHPMVWMSIDYLYQAPPSFPDIASVLDALPDAEEGVEKTLSALCLALDYLESRPDVDPKRTILAGGSLGSFLAVICGGMEPRFEGVVSLYGGGDILEIIETNLPWSSSLSRGFVALSLNPWIGPLDPSKFVEHVSPRPFLMVNGSRDDRIPRECVLDLFEKAGEPKELIWMDTEHRIQDEADLMAEATGIVLEWLQTQGLLGESLPD